MEANCHLESLLVSERADATHSLEVEPAIFRVPFDIIYAIFLAIAKEEAAQELQLKRRSYDWRPAPPSKRPTFPIVCSQICRAWRHMSLDMPLLWSNIWFTQEVKGLKGFDEQILWIERSRAAALDIRVFASYRNRTVARIMRLLRPHVGRWKSFVFESWPQAKVVRTIFDALRHAHAPILELVRVGGNSQPRMGRWKFQPFGGGAPALRELEIACGRCSIPPFARLSKFCVVMEATKISPDDLLLALSTSAPTLEAFEFRGQLALGPRNSAIPFPLTFPKLQVLVLRPDGPSARSTQEFLLQVRAPLVRKVETFSPIFS